MSSEPILKAMQQAAAAYDEAQKKLNDAESVLCSAIEAYTKSVAKLVHAELLTLDWHSVEGRGARSELEVNRPTSGVLNEILHNVDHNSRYGAGGDSCGFDGVRVREVPSSWRGPDRLRVEKASLIKIGYKVKRTDNDARKKMVALLKKHELTPEQLEELLKRGAK